MSDGMVKFAGVKGAFIGVLGGVAIAVGMPFVILKYGAHLHAAVQTTVIIIALLGGGVMAFVSGFFGVILPTNIGPGRKFRGEFTITKDKDGTKTVKMSGKTLKKSEDETDESDDEDEDEAEAEMQP